MQNRDWHNQPNQGFGRSAHDYGHTHLEPAIDSRGEVAGITVIFLIIVPLLVGAYWGVFA